MYSFSSEASRDLDIRRAECGGGWVVPAQVAELLAVEGERLWLGGARAFTVAGWPGGAFTGDHEASTSNQVAAVTAWG